MTFYIVSIFRWHKEFKRENFNLVQAERSGAHFVVFECHKNLAEDHNTRRVKWCTGNVCHENNIIKVVKNWLYYYVYDQVSKQSLSLLKLRYTRRCQKITKVEKSMCTNGIVQAYRIVNTEDNHNVIIQ